LSCNSPLVCSRSITEGWFLGKGVSFEELTKPPNGEKVVSPKKGVSFRETLWRGMMMFLGIKWNTMRRRKWGFPK
jgi:hypothetical protein